MKSQFAQILFVFLLVTGLHTYSQQNNKLSLKFPVAAKMSPQFKAAVEQQQKEFATLMGWNTEIKSYTPAFMLDKIDTSPEYNYLYIAEYWIGFNYQAMIPELIKRVTNDQEIGLVETGDLVIPDRVLSGQMQYYANGPVSEDDLFTVAGRANRLLTLITGENFGPVPMGASPMQLKALQGKWIDWFMKL